MRSGMVTFSALMLLLIFDSRAGAQDSQPTEYQIKAAFVFNFAKFIEWPRTALPTPSSPMVIGVLGDNPFRDVLEKTIRGKTVDEHTLVFREFREVTAATNCHILFISSSERVRLPQIFKYLAGSSVLTVGEMDGFNENGGMINFILKESKIRFKINNDAATSAGLKISSKLLSLASK
jgi:hypothetical protein